MKSRADTRYRIERDEVHTDIHRRCCLRKPVILNEVKDLDEILHFVQYDRVCRVQYDRVCRVQDDSVCRVQYDSVCRVQYDSVCRAQQVSQTIIGASSGSSWCPGLVRSVSVGSIERYIYRLSTSVRSILLWDIRQCR